MSKIETIFGLHSVSALLETEASHIKKLYLQIAREDRRLNAIYTRAMQMGIPMGRVSKHELDQLVGGQNHQGVVAHCRSLQRVDESMLPALLRDLKSPFLLLILDGIQDPHNLGAILRCANALGAQAVIAPKDRAVGITPVVRKVACGAELITPFIAVTNLARTMRYLQDQGIWLVGTEANATERLCDIDLTGNIAIVLGSEGVGMRQLTQKHCDLVARIPLCGSVESLNVAVSGAICLYEVQRQRSSGAE